MTELRRKKSPYASILMDGLLNKAGWEMTILDARPPAMVTPTDILEYSYWKQTAFKLRALDTIRVAPTDKSFYAELLVLSVQKGVGANVEIKYFKDLTSDQRYTPKADLHSIVDEPVEDKELVDKTSEVDTSSYYSKWRGNAWAVMRKSDVEGDKDAVIETGFETQIAAGDAIPALAAKEFV